MVVDAFMSVLEDTRIGEVVISDDCSTDGSYALLLKRFEKESKVRVVRNVKNFDCYKNKVLAVTRCKNEWVVLFDSDNTITTSYLDALYKLPHWKTDTFYCPTFAKPHFDYRNLTGMRMNRSNVSSCASLKGFDCALNTANYFVPRRNYVDVWDDSLDPHTSDTIFQAFNWLKAGGQLEFVQGLEYFHRVHEGSHYKQNVHKTGDVHRRILVNLRNMR